MKERQDKLQLTITDRDVEIVELKEAKREVETKLKQFGEKEDRNKDQEEGVEEAMQSI